MPPHPRKMQSFEWRKSSSSNDKLTNPSMPTQNNLDYENLFRLYTID
jgi:hypothetical protein